MRTSLRFQDRGIIAREAHGQLEARGESGNAVEQANPSQ